MRILWCWIIDFESIIQFPCLVAENQTTASYSSGNGRCGAYTSTESNQEDNGLSFDIGTNNEWCGQVVKRAKVLMVNL